ncbi:hypothetical protein BU25DRAFT_440024 [Macroventuria anomochaeta]|uniref:Uncharacterized protein n=1 Tax=Macroventuria anomochaeta TaxID=301207 RepID=A0ACB6S2N7_9PLEO|nr:uncharacterized protein BU25DRAFT_440024 [Macroventuria anomochaeta]KAF2627644.1 hypothetical protein BU25DRAFT_440024 [Macroventuria anomochaeta]
MRKMAGNYNYDQLATVHETQDIANANKAFNNISPILPPWTSLDEKPGFVSVNSFDTFDSTNSSTSSFEKLKKLGHRIRRKPLPRYLRGSMRVHPATEIESRRVSKGGMAALMTLFAIGMIIVIPYVTYTNTAMLLLINICAIMILGMSNMYQQLVTPIKITYLKHVLSKFDDSRFGTNSPKQSWAAWAFLVLTSMPVHFLGRCLLGHNEQILPNEVLFHDVANMAAMYYGTSSNYYSQRSLNEYASFVCWSALRTGQPHFPGNTHVLEAGQDTYSADSSDFGKAWNTIQAHYDRNCTNYVKTVTDVAALEKLPCLRSELLEPFGLQRWEKGIYCTLHDEEPAECRLNVRMGTAFILAACLVLKAAYMLSVNLLA